MAVERHEIEKSVADEVRGQLDFVRALHASLEQRGAIVISTSGALITLLFAVAGVTARSPNSKVMGSALLFAWLALICLLVAAGLGISLNVPHQKNFKSVDPGVLKKLVKSRGVSMKYMEEEMRVIMRVEAANHTKSHLLLLALIAEALGIAFLAIAAWIIL